MSYAVADIWMMIYALSLPVCRVRVLLVFRVCSCVEVWHILFVLISLYSVFNVQEVILDLVYYFNRTLYR